MARANSPYFSVGSKESAPIKSHTNKAAAIKAAGKDGYIFDRMLEIQMFISKNEEGALETDVSPDTAFDFKAKLYESSMLHSHY
jgi:hypothetical protein